MTASNASGKLTGPYKDSSTNLIYNMLFCDNIELFKNNNQQQNVYPWSILFSDKTDIPGLQKIIEDSAVETRHKILACNKLLASGHTVENKEILGVIVEVGLDEGLDVLASFKDGTARYINQTEKMIIWETTDTTSGNLTKELFDNSVNIVNQIGAWDKPRRPHPARDTVRISFLVSDGLYFGEAPINVLFNEPLAKPALLSATALMQYLTEKIINHDTV
ncbi:MAG: hypothetical protein ABJB11_14540 [Ferruginibacter sp.]